ncbi:unnamed protein product [Prorocentrum cordatum]|uniref:PDZ domain-containing protein n=1 Tax=Prorocentrum cordatum TaxID=2364126 RepID=A0ABN9R0S4_9DINO|nr:unnamed protein product [Polarella glacialis]
MTEAHETGLRLGIVLDRMTDYDATRVHSVQKNGMIQAWNDANPGKDVHVGDEIVQVNNVQWHANTKTFIKHIAGQWKAGRKRWEGSPETFRLYIRRPRVWKHTRFAYQRLDKHQKDYAAEFVAELPLPGDFAEVIRENRMSSWKAMESVMGWKLGATEEWKPAVIKKIEPHGAVFNWNRDHPGSLILEGDELMKVDSIAFQHNSSVFIANVKRHFWAATRVPETNRSTYVSVRRPRAIQDAFDEAHPIKDIQVSSDTQQRITLQFRSELADHLGWQIAPTEDTDSGNSGVVVKAIDQTGLVSRWNEGHPDQSIAPGDHIIEVNGASWELYDTDKEFFNLVLSELQPDGHERSAGELLQLTLERRVRSVMQFRTNMEFGVHMQAQVSAAKTTTELPPLQAPSDSSAGATAVGGQAGASGEEVVDDAGNGKPVGAADDADDDSDVIGAED